MNKEIREYNPNYKSIALLMDLFEYLHNYGYDVTAFTLKIYNIRRETLEYLVIKNVEQVQEFIEKCNTFLIAEKGKTSYNLFLLCYLEVDNRNLERYENRFIVDLKDLYDILIRKVNILRIPIQDKIDREVDRYMQLLMALLTDYRVKYRDSYESIEKEQNELDEHNNYVDGNYMIPIDYVKPQIN